MLKGAGYLILPEQTCNVQGRVETMPFCSHPKPFNLSADSVMSYKPAVFWEVWSLYSGLCRLFVNLSYCSYIVFAGFLSLLFACFKTFLLSPSKRTIESGVCEREQVGGLSAGHYQMPCLKLFLISSGQHIQGTNFGISLCLWIGGDKRPLMALSSPLLFSAPIASPSAFLSPLHLGCWGGGLLVINKMGRDGERVCRWGGRGARVGGGWALVRHSQV